MKMKKQSWSLSLENKGLIFSFDIMVAVLLVVVLLLAGTFYAAKSGEYSLSRLQMIRTGSDILAILDYDGTLKTLSMPTIEAGINELLPTSYHMRIEIKGREYGPLIIETTPEAPKDRFIGSGERVFNKNAEYYIARYWIWLR